MRRAVPLLALLLLAAGCLGPSSTVDPAAAPAERAPLTEPTFALGEFISTKFPGHDGTPLHVDLQLPDGEGPFPVLVMYSPYTNNLNADDEAWGATAGATGPAAFVDYYVPRGYAVGIAHVRGSGQSGGCFTMGSADEAKDGYALVEWLAEQPWSSGKVALLGTSYLGTTPISTATLNPPHLTTIVPVSSVTEWYKYYFENGEPRFFGELPFGVVYTDHPLWMGINVLPKPRNPTAAANAPQNAQCAADIGLNAYAQDDYNAFWMERNYVKDVANATAPMLYAHGFLDENTPTSLVPEFYNAYPGVKRMWLQQHGHGVPRSFEAYHEHVHRWLDHFMLGLDNGALDMPPVVLQDNRGKYHWTTEWPTRAESRWRLHLAPGVLANTTAPPEGQETWREDLRAWEEVAQPVLSDGTYLRFETEPFPNALHLSGVPTLHLVASSDRTDTQLAATLWEVKADGTGALVTRGYMDARHRESLEKGQDLVPGEAYAFHFPMHARDWHVEEGSRLVLYVQSTDKYVVPDGNGARNTLHYGPEGSWLEVPLVAADGFADQPPTVS
jgi:X-Pro dipeptidyl-peptidase